jgi:hypothetical protein
MVKAAQDTFGQEKYIHRLVHTINLVAENAGSKTYF